MGTICEPTHIIPLLWREAVLWHSLLFRSCDSFFWSTAISCWASLLCFLQICCMISYVCCVTGALCVLSKWLKHLCLASGCFATMSWPARQPEHNISKVQEKPTKDGKFIVPRWETEPAGGIMGEAPVVLFFTGRSLENCLNPQWQAGAGHLVPFRHVSFPKLLFKVFEWKYSPFLRLLLKKIVLTY